MIEDNEVVAECCEIMAAVAEGRITMVGDDGLRCARQLNMAI